MTHQYLQNYRKMKSETKLIEREIDALQSRDKTESAVSGNLEQKIQSLAGRKIRLEAILADIEQFIDSLDDFDSELRQIIILRYIKGMPWRKVVREVYDGCADETMPLQKVKRFLAKQ